MKKRKILAFVLCQVLLFALLSACAEKTTVAEESAVTSNSTGTAVSVPTPTPAPEDELAPTPAPEGEEDGLHSSSLPAPEVGSNAFAVEFIGNPIDKKYDLDMEDASSNSAMSAACSEAAKSWKAQIDAAYMQIIDSADAGTVEKVKAEQESWIDAQNDSLQEIRNSVDEEDAMAAVTVAREIMLYYRSRAIELCAVLYEIDGQLVFG